MGQGSDISNTGFSDIDATGKAEAYVAHQDRINVRAAAAYKGRTYELLAPQPGHRLLDVGCGTGDDVRALAGLVGPTGQVVGVDRSEGMIAEARRRAEGTSLTVEFHLGDAHQLDFPDAAFDGVRADRVLHHLDEPERAYAELVRVTRPGGRVVVSDPDFDMYAIDHPDAELTRRFLTFMAANVARSGGVGRRLYGFLRRAGLEEVAVEFITFQHRDIARARDNLHLDVMLERAAAAGVIGAEEGARWLGELEVADTAGQFFSAAVGFMVAGRKPG